MFEVKVFSTKDSLFERSVREAVRQYSKFLSDNKDKIADIDVKSHHYVDTKAGVNWRHEFVIIVTVRYHFN